MAKTKQNPTKINRVARTVKQHVSFVSDENEVKKIAECYKNVKNYVYSRYSGINSLLLIKNYKKEIRNGWVKSGFADQWDLPARYWKLALDEAISNIKSKWSNIKNDIRKALRSNDHLTEDEKLFIYYVLKADEILHAILVYQTYQVPKKIANLIIQETYIHNLIRRYIRKYKKKIPYSKNCGSFTIDRPMYKYYKENGESFIEITSSVPRKRIFFKVKDKNIFSGNIRIVLKNSSIELHHYTETKEHKRTHVQNEIGIDKGYKTLIATSLDHLYGERLNEFLNKETDRLNIVNAKRNQIWSLIKKYEKEGNTQKANRIKENNIGRKKNNKQKDRHDAAVKSYINYSLNQFFLIEKPSDVIQEDLSFVSWKDKFPKHIKRKLSRWIKGYIKERIEFKCQLLGIQHHKVNAAYTSQVCHKCNRFGERKEDVFTCPNCGDIHADINASHNIKARKNDLEITLYTNYKKVKEILENRTKMQTI